MNNRVVRRLKMCGNGFMDEIIILNRFSSTKELKNKRRISSRHRKKAINSQS